MDEQDRETLARAKGVVTSDIEREAILLQNELLREPRFAAVRARLRRCCVCARRRCKDRQACRDELELWTRARWDDSLPFNGNPLNGRRIFAGPNPDT